VHVFRSLNNPLSSFLIKLKAQEINQDMIGETGDVLKPFSATDGWYRGFKRRYNLKTMKIQGEKASADHSAFEKFKTEFPTYIRENRLTLKQIYNADETGLILKQTPRTTVATSNESSASGRKGEKSRVTIMPCSNADGSNKLPLLLIGSSKSPRCFPRDRRDFQGT
jgi:hypothetical protein